MFTASEFVFNGKSCYQFETYLCAHDSTGQDDVPFGTQAKIVESATSSRISPIHHGVNYHESQLEFNLVLGSYVPFSRFRMQKIANWLNLGGQGYGWLQVCQLDLENVLFKCMAMKLTPITVGSVPYALNVEFRCDCPYAYGLPYEAKYRVIGSSSVLFRNHGTALEYLKPQLKIETYGGTDTFKITNCSDKDREFELTGVPARHTIYVDNTNGIITDDTDGTNLYNGFNKNFFRIVHGDNELKFEGRARVTISGRFLYNVGA